MARRRPRPDEQEYTLLEQTAIRQAIGDRTRTSMQEKPQFWMSTQVDATALLETRSRAKESGAEVVPTFNDYIIKAVALTLRDNPRFNAWVAEDGLHVLKHINVGFAVATEQGVLLPTLMDADQKSVGQIAEETGQLIAQARAAKLRASLQMGAGFTVSNIGPTEVDAFNGIISPPQTGILAIGAIKQRPVVVDGQVVARPTMILTLTVEHAAADGADGAKFLGELKAVLEDAEALGGM